MAALFDRQCTANVTSRERAHVTSKHGGGGIRDRNYCSSSRPGSPPLPSSSLPSTTALTHSVSQTQLTRYKVGGGGLKTALISKTYRAARSSIDATQLVLLPRSAAVHIRSGFFLCFPCFPFFLVFLVIVTCVSCSFLHPPS